MSTNIAASPPTSQQQRTPQPVYLPKTRRIAPHTMCETAQVCRANANPKWWGSTVVCQTALLIFVGGLLDAAVRNDAPCCPDSHAYRALGEKTPWMGGVFFSQNNPMISLDFDLLISRNHALNF
jgi:hypothetical protein